MLVQELQDLGAPPDVVEAGKVIDSGTASLSVIHELSYFVLEWVSKQRRNNRYGL